MQIVNHFTAVAIYLLVNLATAQGEDGAAQDSLQAADEINFGGGLNKRNDDRFEDFGGGRNRNDDRFNNNRVDFEDSLRDYIDDRDRDDQCPFFCRQSLRRTLFCRREIPGCRYSRRNWDRNNRRYSDRNLGFQRRCPMECRRANRVARQCQGEYDKCEEFNVFDYDFD